MKRTKRIVSLLLVLCLALSFSIGALAKTSSEPIEAPAGDFAVFTVSAAGKTAGFTWDEINGKGDFKSVTGSYAAKVDGVQTTEEWTGIPLSALLDAAAEELGFGFEDDYKISVEAADGYVSVFTVGDARDEENAYIVAPDPVKNFDGETAYPDSYVRILLAAETSNKANIRCVTGITIKGADGSDLMATAGTEAPAGGKTQGGDVENAVFYIAVKESAESEYKFYYYTREEIAAYGDEHGISYVDHSIPKTVNCRGASLGNMLADIADAEITGDMIVQYAESDGYHADAKTPIEDSAYKDKVEWLGAEHLTSGGETAAAVETMISLDTKTVYETPDENHVNSADWEDADDNSGYLRAYRQRGDANSAVIKTLMGVVVSYDGAQFTGKDGYTLKAESAEGAAMRIIEPSTGKAYTSQSVTGLVPGMQWAVKAPEIAGAKVSGESVKLVTAEEGTAAEVKFTYKENDYLKVNDKVYTLSSLEALEAATQTPSVDEVKEHGTPYGYYDAMYYRYAGVWLKDLVAGEVTAEDADGNKTVIAADEVEKYFVATGYTASKSDTNVSEGKRYTFAYSAPQLIIPGDGTLVGEAEAKNEGNKKVTVAIEKLAALTGEESAAQAALFDDVSEGDWFYDAVSFAVEKGLMNGVGEGKFDPKGLTTRGMVVTILYRLAGSPAVSGESKFWDVKEGDWYYDAVLWANENGIAQGYDEIDPQIKGGGGAFGAKDYITRAQFATMLYRYEQLQGGGFTGLWSFELEYDDVGDIADFALEPISWCVMNGIINGRTETTIAPAGDATRAEIATMFMRYMQLEA